MRDLVKVTKSVGRTLDLLSGISVTVTEVVSGFLFVCPVSILPGSRKRVLLPAETARTPVGTIDSLWRKY